MKLCSKCGSRARREAGGFKCPRCENLIYGNAAMQSEALRKRENSDAVCVVDSSANAYVKVTQTFPEYGKGEAYDWFYRSLAGALVSMQAFERMEPWGIPNPRSARTHGAKALRRSHFDDNVRTWQE